MSIHHGVSCDLCRKISFSDRRYKCLICNDFDLCSVCYDEKQNLTAIQTHSINHSMQIIITKHDFDHIYFGFKHSRHSLLLSLSCPYCNQNGFTLNLLNQHIQDRHNISLYSVLCPICFVRRNNLCQHLNQHLDENINLNIKTFKPLNLNEKQVKPTQESLLEKLMSNNYQNRNESEQRNLFVYSLLTDLLGQ
ncbi:unnamed protein product [Rotaria magnacalcarata]|uniref:RING-type E3 ubiquitin transferase n=2 Tax=Rotaria magnacalcarata TaxID=392030 RepID=A0A814RF30_9BILA|nr:unnamed protein product [Rotaria magnacalcarata]CAF1354763.1 unnamed protein product [Rotaria magnacalcarata]CAF3886714.1 unnamed protein product [Rotaria magnacalcarata]